jgi:precorrin-2/cobalt-factor-2 C20-methyltransferase
MSLDELNPVERTGRLYGVGVGPGDPELMSVKAARLVSETADVAYFAARDRPSNARRVVEHLLGPGHRELRITYPVTTEAPPPEQSYEDLLIRCYDEAAEQIAERLRAGRDVVVLCEGDPLLYGSYMYLHNRLAPRFPTTVVPGIGSVAVGAAVIGRPLACADDVLSVLSGVMGHDELKAALGACDAAVIIKLGRNLAKVRAALAAVGLEERAFYVERASSAEEVWCPLAEADAARAPYFSMIVVPSARAGRR